MEVVYNRTIELYKTTSSDTILKALQERFTETILTKVLIPLSSEEVLLEDMIDELVEKNILWENAPASNRKIHIEWNLLTVQISQWQEIADAIKTLYN